MSIKKIGNCEGSKSEIEKASSLINPHLLRNKIVDLKPGFEIVRINPNLLITSKRFDIVAKYIYACFQRKKINSKWGEEIYCNHIYAFNKYKEGDGSRKLGKTAFLKSFDSVLQSVGQNGFDTDVSIVPISHDNIVIDGAHRVSACLAHQKDIICLRVHKHISREYNYSYFLNKGMKTIYADYIAFEYCKLVKSSYLAVVFPSAAGGETEINNAIQAIGSTVYRKEIELSNQGMFNLVKQIYADEPWIGSWNNNFRGARDKADFCFQNGGKTRVYLIESNSLEKVKVTKDKIRSFFGVGNHSIHINDTHDEAIYLSKMLFNKNSIHFLNNTKHKSYRKNDTLFEEFKSKLIEQNADIESFCIDGSFAMAAYGIREANDLDFIHQRCDHITFINPYISDHNDQASHHSKSKDDLIFNPENHFYYKGIKVITLANLYSMKSNRSEPKDIHDCALIDASIRQRSTSYILYLSIKSKIERFRCKLSKKMIVFLKKVKRFTEEGI